MSMTTHTPNPIDLHVGGRIRMRRKMLGLSQESLAGDLSLTFQQIQKYERGANRVSASKLYEIAQSLRVGIDYFFDGLADPIAGLGDSGADADFNRFMMTSEGAALAATFPKIPAGPTRRIILDLVRVMAGEGEPALRAVA